jgi:cytochrome P450/NADPH-cytochrome P450 reductase
MAQIPQPRGLPIVGNVNEFDSSDQSKGFARLADTYGPIFRVNIFGRSVVVVNTQDLANDVCDEKRFHKVPTAVLGQVRNGVKDGLFTAFEEEDNWGLAHRILVPKFGPMAMADMYPEMYEIACQLVSRWAREPLRAIDPTQDFTKLTLDSIALCAMDTRFNSFYR